MGLEEQSTQSNGVSDPQSAAPPSNNHWTPETVIATLPLRPQTDSSSPVPFFHLLERLKTTKREGWRRFGIDKGESISDHMYRMSILTMLAPQSLSSRLNIPHCTKMALIHDMAEALVGDITPVDGVSKPEKSRRETETMDYICKGLLGNVSGGLSGEEIRSVWQEYEDSQTLESQFVHDIDKMELILQMMEYERANEGRIDLGEFSWVARKITLPEVQEWSKEVMREREQFWKGVGKTPTRFDVEEPEASHTGKMEEYYQRPEQKGAE